VVGVEKPGGMMQKYGSFVSEGVDLQESVTLETILCGFNRQVDKLTG
jgi:hypothetical protein